MNVKYKIIILFISFLFLLAGIILIHIAYNGQTRYFGIFNIHNFDGIFLFDLGITSIIFSFFLLYILIFKPIKYIND